MAGKEKKAKKGGEDRQGAGAPVAFAGYPGFEKMREEMQRMMQLTGGDWLAGMGRMPSLTEWMRAGGDSPLAAFLNAPKSEMTETDGGYELTIELPGMDEKDIELTFTDRTLLLKGEKTAEKETKEKDYHFSERTYGSVRRRYVLPENVDRDAVKASFSKGVLKVALPKSREAAAKSRRIEVSGA